MAELTENTDFAFAVFAEVKEHEKPLVMMGLSFGRLIDDIVLPLEENKPFFIDGAPVKKDNVKRIKILKEKESLSGNIADLHWIMRRGNVDLQKIIPSQYHIRIEALLREGGEDVTSQVLKAFDTAIKPKLKDYLPNRVELINAASRIFVEALKSLGGV